MKGVILAAGDGGRLRPLTLHSPKALLEAGGRPLIHYAIDAFTSAGMSDIAIVVGYQAEKIEEALGESYPDLTFIYNEHYLAGNAISVYAVRSFAMDEPFVLCMGDHPISPRIVESLLSESGDGSILCVDQEASHASQTNDATRVLLSPAGDIATIGKDLTTWDAIDTGVFRMTGDFFPAVEHLMETAGNAVNISDVVRYMGNEGSPFSVCDVSGMFWADVDTVEDYEAIDGLLRETDGDCL